MRNANKSPEIPYSEMATEADKLIRNPYPRSDHDQKLISSSDW